MQALRRLQNSIESSPRSRLADAPFAFENIRIVEERRPEGFRFSGFALSIHSKLNGEEIIACGESHSHQIAEAKAVSELIERAALISFGKKFSAETSNGWAAHPDKDEARVNAICELMERDAVLAQWYCAEPFVMLQGAGLPLDIQEWALADLAQSEFPRLTVLLSTKGIGPSITCILSNNEGFGICAHATRVTLAESVRSALAEACRGAHSAIRRENWKDTLQLKAGAPGRIGPGAHALYHAYHEPFPQWMFGPLVNWKEANSVWNTRIAPTLADNSGFEFRVVLNHPLCVGFATHPAAIPLRWGTTDTERLEATEAMKRLNRTKINKEPHIVS